MNTYAAGDSTTVDHAALFEEIFKTHFRGLHLYAAAIVKSEAIAEEIVQNIFLGLWERKEQVPEVQSIAAYLYRVVHNESLNYIKHAKIKAKHREHTVNNSNEYDAATDPAAIKELQQRIDAALLELPEQCRTVFQMSRFEDLTYRGIADKLGISLKTVEKQMGKALRLMRIKLAEFLPVLLLIIKMQE
jgi:RNA polymerase sigma-70 factor, ECF subfamily